MNLNHPHYKDALDPADRALLSVWNQKAAARQRRQPLLDAINNGASRYAGLHIGLELAETAIALNGSYTFNFFSDGDEIGLSVTLNQPINDRLRMHYGLIADRLFRVLGLCRWSVKDDRSIVCFHYDWTQQQWAVECVRVVS